MSYPASYAPLADAEYYTVEWLAPGVLGVAMNRPPLNTFNRANWLEMHRVFKHIPTDGEIRAVILYSKGRAFTAGLDLKETALSDAVNDSIDAARAGLTIRAIIDEFQAAISAIEECQRPVIGVSHGYSIGLAIDILSAVDIRYTARDVTFSIREAAIGLAADIGTLQRFPKIVGNDSLARELVYTARYFDAEEALRIGFVSRILETPAEALSAYFTSSDRANLDAAIETAKIIAANSPIAVTGSKTALVYSRDHSVAEGLHYMQLLNAAALQTEDMAAAVMATLQRTKPTFSKL
ncbi:hypothetical protein MCUN1_002814 [Malassezia cuniculi]|uniref:Enoyl-CoA hydratase n=1 Tax=Malassezia cuniculi TaxID=948313 RepID=A0AAF0ES36_9BASI|nr:hypothetical protein MCUN1_002814 [Malassezia cuniculi]